MDDHHGVDVGAFVAGSSETIDEMVPRVVAR